MSFSEAVEYIYSLTNFELLRGRRVPEDGIKNVRKVLEYLQVDFTSIPTFHVAGTKGKGTVSTVVSYILSRLGKKVGLFTSPHLVSITERISILSDGKVFNIPESDFESVYLRVREAKEKLNIDLTTFDFLTVMAMVYFVSKKLDYVVLEVGLGGKLDSTNFCLPKVCGITLIDYDHTDVLGDTLEKIAWEKCGIIKDGVSVVSMYQDESVRKVISRASEEKNAELTFVDDVYKLEDVKISKDGVYAKVRNLENNQFFDFRTSLIGEHFVWNILMAFEMIRKIENLDYSVLEYVDPPIKGRFEILRRNPFVVFDVAHTPSSVAKSISTFIKLTTPPRVLVLSILRDKEIDRISEVLANFREEFLEFYVLRLKDPNDGSEVISRKLEFLGIENLIIDQVREAYSVNTLFIGSFRSYSVVVNKIVRGGGASF